MAERPRWRDVLPLTVGTLAEASAVPDPGWCFRRGSRQETA